MRIAAKTDIGMVRDTNQDAYDSGELPGGVTWAVVCDGMGGAAGGSIASSTAVKTISEQISSRYRDGMTANSIRNLLISAVTAANVKIFDLSEANMALRGMGTTVVAAIITEHTAYVAHVGDSRAYCIENNKIFQLTRDHSMVQEMVDNGEITPEQAREHPKKNIITRALGVEETVNIDFCEQQLENGDILLLCTDGLTNYIEDDEVLQLCTDRLSDCEESDDSYSEIAKVLVDKANRNGGGDNITVVAISY